MNYIMDLRKTIGHRPIHMPTCAVIVVDENKILLQKRKDLDVWAIHGGALELGETLEEAALRELYEETNLEVKDLMFFRCYAGKDFYIKYPNGDEAYVVDHIFIATQFKGVLKPQVTEVSKLKWFDLKDIPWKKLMGTNKIILKDYIASLE